MRRNPGVSGSVSRSRNPEQDIESTRTPPADRAAIRTMGNERPVERANGRLASSRAQLHGVIGRQRVEDMQTTVVE